MRRITGEHFSILDEFNPEQIKEICEFNEIDMSRFQPEELYDIIKVLPIVWIPNVTQKKTVTGKNPVQDQRSCRSSSILEQSKVKPKSPLSTSVAKKNLKKNGPSHETVIESANCETKIQKPKIQNCVQKSKSNGESEFELKNSLVFYNSNLKMADKTDLDVHPFENDSVNNDDDQGRGECQMKSTGRDDLWSGVSIICHENETHDLCTTRSQDQVINSETCPDDFQNHSENVEMMSDHVDENVEIDHFTFQVPIKAASAAVPQPTAESSNSILACNSSIPSTESTKPVGEQKHVPQEVTTDLIPGLNLPDPEALTEDYISQTLSACSIIDETSLIPELEPSQKVECVPAELELAKLLELDIPSSLGSELPCSAGNEPHPLIDGDPVVVSISDTSSSDHPQPVSITSIDRSYADLPFTEKTMSKMKTPFSQATHRKIVNMNTDSDQNFFSQKHLVRRNPDRLKLIRKLS